MIKLKSLLNITEQAPMAPPAPGAPVPLQTPPTGAEPSPEETPTTPEPDADTTPGPEDPGEYDWTKDFRAFEDAKNKAEAQAKKKLLDKMNKQLVGKKATTNASRGYGQPKTDYTIDKIKKVSVEFWYKEWVVIITDENDKKYFLTPGVNIKIEQGAGGEAGGPDDQAPTEPDAAQTGATGEEQPNAQSPAVPPGPDMGMGQTAGGPPAGGGEIPPVPGATAPAPAQPAAPQPQPPEQQPAEPLKKKKKPLAETVSSIKIANDIGKFLCEFMSDKAFDKYGEIDFSRYVKNVKSVMSESRSHKVYKARLEIPVDHIKENVDLRDIQLAVKESMWSSGNVDQRFSRGSIDISKVGRVYIMNFTKQTGWKF